MEAPFQGTCKISSQGPFSKEFTRSLHLYKDPWKNSQDLYIRRLARNLQDLLTRTKSIHKIYLQGPVQGTYKISLQEPFQKKKHKIYLEGPVQRTCKISLQEPFSKEFTRSPHRYKDISRTSQNLFTKTFSIKLQDLFTRTLQENSQDLQTRTLRVHKLSVQGPFEICKIFTRTAQKNSQDLYIYIYIYTRTLGRNLRTLSRNWQNLHARSLSHKNSQDLYFYTSPHKAGGGSFHSEDVFI